MLRRLIVNTFVALVAAIPLAAQEAAPAPRIIVTGEGQVQATPDMATLSIGVGHEAPTAAEAMEEVAATVQGLFTRLTELGVAPRDVQTTGLRIDPIWRDRSRSTPEETPEIVGFRARNDLSVRLRDMDRLGEAIGLLVADGANRLSGISFGVQSPEVLLTEARKLAVVDAQARRRSMRRRRGSSLARCWRSSSPAAARAPARCLPAPRGCRWPTACRWRRAS